MRFAMNFEDGVAIKQLLSVLKTRLTESTAQSFAEASYVFPYIYIPVSQNKKPGLRKPSLNSQHLPPAPAQSSLVCHLHDYGTCFVHY